MVRPGRDRLAGTVEVDETYLGGLEEGLRGRQTEAKAPLGWVLSLADRILGMHHQLSSNRARAGRSKTLFTLDSLPFRKSRLWPFVVAGIGGETLFQSAGSQPQHLPPRRREVQVGHRRAA